MHFLGSKHSNPTSLVNLSFVLNQFVVCLMCCDDLNIFYADFVVIHRYA